jgi:hypothetical protein
MSARKYAPPQMKFMRDKIHELEELGLVYKNIGEEWASPPLILPKPGPDHCRMTVDMRVPTASTNTTAWPMPNLQDVLHDLHRSEVFAPLYCCQGYWKIPLHKDSQDCQSFITPDGVYAPTRVLHGTRNATQYLQYVLVVMMDDIKNNIKVWLDDCLLHTKPRSKAWRNHGVYCMDHNGEGRQGVFAELIALCRAYSWRQSATPAGYAATRNQDQLKRQDTAFRLPVH